MNIESEMEQKKHFVVHISVIFILNILSLCGSAVDDNRSQASSIIIVEDAKSK